MKKVLASTVPCLLLIILVVWAFRNQNTNHISSPSKVGNIGNAERPSEPDPPGDIGNRPIKGGYGVALIIDTADPQDLDAIRNFIVALKGSLKQDPSNKYIYYIRTVPVSDQLRPFQLFIALGPSVPDNVRQFIYNKDNPLLSSSHFVEYQKKESLETMSDKILQFMGENSVAKAWFVHNTSTILEGDIRDMFQQLFY